MQSKIAHEIIFVSVVVGIAVLLIGYYNFNKIVMDCHDVKDSCFQEAEALAFISVGGAMFVMSAVLIIPLFIDPEYYVTKSQKSKGDA